MAGRITDADKERVRDANRIDSVVGDYVALKGAGGGNLKGLCPFHDEKTPSFQVSPTRGTYHCFGCGQGGDVFAFIAGIEHLDFVEAVQRLADRVGITLTMVEGGTSTRVERGSRSRLIAANKAAAVFYEAQLATDDAAPARAFLAERGFDDAAAAQFSCGYAPAGWDQLFKALTAQGFTVEELDKAGLINKNGQRGPIDRFHRRLLWAIHDAAGDVVGFGARRLYDDDRLEAKYINTSETPLYKKSQLLYGLDLAKKEIARQRQVVVVEGYTDVMAMHLAGVTTAVASCGTAFGEEHISILRRYLLDNEVIRGQVIYTFDGDSAGQKAALKAYDSDQRFASNTFIAVAPDGMDPCELRQAHGDGAVRDLVAARQPLFAFAIKSTLAGFDLNTVEGRVAAAAAAVPMVARIKESETREGYAVQLAGWLGADLQAIASRVRQHAAAEAKAANIADRRAQRATEQQAASEPGGQLSISRPRPRDTGTFSEREALKLVLQQPLLLSGDYAYVDEAAFTDPAYRAVHLAVQAAGGPAQASSVGATAWVTSIGEHLPAGVLRSLITELAIEPLRTKSDDETRYAGAILADLHLRVAKINEAALRSELQRAEASGDGERAGQLNADLAEMAKYRRALSERARGA